MRGSSCSGAIAASCVELKSERKDHRRSIGCRKRMSESTYRMESTCFKISCEGETELALEAN